MKTVPILFALSLFLTGLVAPTPARADGSFDDYGYELTPSQLEELRLWHNELPAVGDAGRAFIGCSATRNSTEARFNQHFDTCWTVPNVPGNCAHRCGAAYNVFGFWARSNAGPGRIDYTIFCRCNQIVHWYDQYPVPRILVDLGVAN